jgi:hypothetical protein
MVQSHVIAVIGPESQWQLEVFGCWLSLQSQDCCLLSPSATHLLHMVNVKPLPSLGSAPGIRLPAPPANCKAPSPQPDSASGTGSMPQVTTLLDAKGRGRSWGLPGVPSCSILCPAPLQHAAEKGRERGECPSSLWKPAAVSYLVNQRTIKAVRSQGHLMFIHKQ